MTTKILELEDYGYKGKTLSLREPSGADMIAVNDFMIRERKAKGDVNQMMASLVLLSRLIEDAPFDKKVDTLKELPLRLLKFLDKEVEEMINPLPKSSEESC
jgi:hypothetical protein